MWVCLLFALVISTNSWADPTDVTWDGKTGAMFPSGSAGSPASDTKSGITLTTNCPAATAYIANRTLQCYSYEVAPSENYIDITTNGQELTNVNVSIVYIGGSGANSVKVSFSSGASFDGDALLGSSPYTITGTNDQSGDVTCEIAAPPGAKSARIYRKDTGWGPYLHRIRVTADEATPCSAPVTISYKKSGSETGSAPADREVCTDNTSTITLPGKNTLVYDDKHVFVGWEKGEVIYPEGATYDITSDISNVEFTAAWKELNVTNLAITNPENNTIPLSWKIPGICDLSKVMEPFTPNGGAGVGSKDSYTYHYNDGEEYDYVDAQGDSPKWGQYGIGFPITPTTGIEWLSFDYKGEHADMSFWGALYNQNNTAEVYNDFGNDKALNDDENWQESGELHPNKYYWNYDFSGAITDKEITHVAIYVNSGDHGGFDDVQVSIRNVHYHVAGRADIDHIVLVRKAGSVPANKEDGDVIYTGTKSHFTDTDVKTSGTTYFYAVFAVYSDASVSSPVYVSHTIEAATEYTVTYAKGADNVTGDVPTEGNHIVGAQFTVADKGNLARPGHHFAGWNDGTNDYAAGTTYTMPAENVTLTAQWTPFTVPQVTNLAITEPVGQTVPLSWTIPGICDLSNPVLPKYQQVGTTTLKEYKPNGDYVSVSGTTPGNNQFGVAFGIPATTNIEWLSFEYRGAVAWNVNLWGGLCDAEDEANAYWQMQDPMTIHPSDAVNWASSGELRPNIGYWNGNPSSLANPLTQSISQVAVYANASGSETSDISYEVRNVRYHIAGQEDIDHVIVVRKDGAIPADHTDGTVYNVGTKSHFLDNDGTKEFGHTYYYRVFAFHEDGTYSASEPTLQTIEDVATYTVTYEYGADNATGDLPTEGEHIEGASFTVAGGGNLTRPGHHFAGWNDGTNDYAAGTTYTMPAKNVTLTAQWDEMIVPNVTGLAISDNELSWNIPGKINLSTWSLSNSTPDYFIEYEKPVADGNVYYDNETEELAVTHSSPAWDQYGVAIPIEITNLESVTYYYKGHNIFLAVVKKTEDVLFWQNNSVSASSEGETITRTPTTIYLNNGLVNPLPTTRAITFCTNPDHKATDETFYIRDVFYHTTGMVDIDHVVLMRKEGSASTGLSDGNLLYSGKLSHYVDNEIKPTGTYYYTVFAVHADGTLSSGETVSAAYENPYKTHTRTGLTAGDYGTICLPYAVAAEDRNGAELFEIEEWGPNGSSLTIGELNADENMIAGRPYIFQATEATATFRYYAEGDETEAGEHNGLIGSYVQAPIPQNDDNYIIYNNKLYLVNSEAYVGANRAYIHKQDQVQPAPAYRRRVTLSVNGAQVITDIDQINDPAQMTKYIENGHLFIFREGKLYNAQGQLVK